MEKTTFIQGYNCKSKFKVSLATSYMHLNWGAFRSINSIPFNLIVFYVENND